MININVYVTIVIRWFTFIWARPAGGNDTQPSDEQVAPGSEPPTAHTSTSEHLGTSLGTGMRSADETPISEDDICRRGQAVGEAVNTTDTDISVEEEINSVGIDTETAGSLYPHGHETVGVPEDDEADLVPGERPQAASRWARVGTRLASTPAHWTCDRDSCRRCEQARNRRTERQQFYLIQLRSFL